MTRPCYPSYRSTFEKNVEAFAATEEDTAAPMHGRNTPIVLGQVGIRCMHCKHEDLAERGLLSTSYPTGIRKIQHAAQQMLKDHISCCTSMPSEVRDRIQELKLSSGRAARGTKEYWIDSAERLGLVDTQHGIFFSDSPLPSLELDDQPTSDKDDDEDKRKSPPPARKKPALLDDDGDDDDDDDEEENTVPSIVLPFALGSDTTNLTKEDAFVKQCFQVICSYHTTTYYKGQVAFCCALCKSNYYFPKDFSQDIKRRLKDKASGHFVLGGCTKASPQFLADFREKVVSPNPMPSTGFGSTLNFVGTMMSLGIHKNPEGDGLLLHDDYLAYQFDPITPTSITMMNVLEASWQELMEGLRSVNKETGEIIPSIYEQPDEMMLLASGKCGEEVFDTSNYFRSRKNKPTKFRSHLRFLVVELLVRYYQKQELKVFELFEHLEDPERDPPIHFVRYSRKGGKPSYHDVQNVAGVVFRVRTTIKFILQNKFALPFETDADNFDRTGYSNFCSALGRECRIVCDGLFAARKRLHNFAPRLSHHLGLFNLQKQPNTTLELCKVKELEEKYQEEFELFCQLHIRGSLQEMTVGGKTYRKVCQGDHLAPMSAEYLLASLLVESEKFPQYTSDNYDKAGQKAVLLLSSVWNVVPAYWAKNLAKWNFLILHCYVDHDTHQWFFISRKDLNKDEWDYHTIFELFEAHQDKLFDEELRIFWEHWGLPKPTLPNAQIAISFSREDAEQKFYSRVQPTGEEASFGAYRDAHPEKTHLYRPSPTKEMKEMTDIDKDEHSLCGMEENDANIDIDEGLEI